MSQLLDIPVMLAGYTYEGKWELMGEESGIPWEENGIPLIWQHNCYEELFYPSTFCGEGKELDEAVDAITHELANPIELLREFTGIRTVAGLLAFLNSTGVFCDPGLDDDSAFLRQGFGPSDRGTLIYQVTDFWRVQELLAEMLLSRKPLVQIRPLSLPEWWAEAFNQGFLHFRLAFRTREYCAQITTHDTLTTLIAAAQTKVLKGARFRVCKRPDCQQVFEVETRGRRKKMYCDHLCAHTAWQRKARKTQIAVVDERRKFGFGSYGKKKRG